MQSWSCRQFAMDVQSRVLIMGVVNVTPDSFSDGGQFQAPEQAIAHALALVDDGADLIDIGGESTRPGAESVSAAVEIERIVPVIEALAGSIDVPISVDTSKAEVAEAALSEGASIVNDVSAAADSRMPSVMAQWQAGCILMHRQGTPQTMQLSPQYDDVVHEVCEALSEAANRVEAAGVSRQAIALDPGFGFGKRLEDNLALLGSLEALTTLGYPIVVGPSHKSFIGELLHRPVADRGWGTAAAVAWCALHGAGVVRVHDAGAMRQVVEMVEAIRHAAATSSRLSLHRSRDVVLEALKEQ